MQPTRILGGEAVKHVAYLLPRAEGYGECRESRQRSRRPKVIEVESSIRSLGVGLSCEVLLNYRQGEAKRTSFADYESGFQHRSTASSLPSSAAGDSTVRTRPSGGLVSAMPGASVIAR